MLVNVNVRELFGVNHSQNCLGTAMRRKANVFNLPLFLKVQCELVDSVGRFVEYVVDLFVLRDAMEREQIDVPQSFDVGPS